MNFDVKSFVKLLQDLKEILGIERLESIIDYSFGTFWKQYDNEEELEVLEEDLTKYIANDFPYPDEAKKENIEWEAARVKKLKDFEELKKAIEKIKDFLPK